MQSCALVGVPLSECHAVVVVEAGLLVGFANHGVSLSLYAKDPDGLEFGIFLDGARRAARWARGRST
jgi:catechol-2,3-dioxygenase